MTDTKLYPSPLHGYRSWRVEEGILKSLTQNKYWNEVERTASCVVLNDPRNRFTGEVRRSHKEGYSPVVGCTCGLYACHDPFDRQIEFFHQVDNIAEYIQRTKVFGVVEAWGKIENGDRAFRAQHMKIVAFLNGGNIGRVSPNYPSVPVYNLPELLWKYPPRDLTSIPPWVRVVDIKPSIPTFVGDLYVHGKLAGNAIYHADGSITWGPFRTFSINISGASSVG